MFFLFILSFWYRWWHHSGRLGYTTSCFAGSLPASKRSIECIMRTHRFGYHPSLGQGNSRTGIELHFFFTKVLLFFVPDWTRAQYLFEPFELYKKTQGLLNEVRFLNWKKIKFLFFVTTQVRRDAEKETLFFLLFGLLLLFFFVHWTDEEKNLTIYSIFMTVGEENGSTFDCPWSAIDQWFWSWNRSQHSGIIIRTELKSVVKFLFHLFIYIFYRTNVSWTWRLRSSV